MPSTSLPNTHHKSPTPWGARVIKCFDYYLLTVVDTLFFAFFAVQTHTARGTQKAEVKKKLPKGKQREPAGIDLNQILAHTAKDIEWRHRAVPFVIRLLPTLILAAMVWIIRMV